MDTNTELSSKENINILISMCMLGVPCRYNGKAIHNINDLINKYPKVNFIPVCSEQLGGLPTPRLPAEIIHGAGDDVINNNANVVNESGVDVTDNFIKGSECVLSLAKKYLVKIFIGCANSPSCSCSKIYDGNFKGILEEGLGVTSALLKQNGIQIIEIKEFDELYANNS